MKIIDLRENKRFLGPYVRLRNKYANQLLTDPVTLKETKLWLDAVPVEIRCLAERNRLLGAIILYPDKNNEITIFVRKTGRGLGEKLLLAIERVCPQKYDKFWAWVLSDNIRAQKFFENHGYLKGKINKRIFHGKSYFGYLYTKDISKTPATILMLRLESGSFMPIKQKIKKSDFHPKFILE